MHLYTEFSSLETVKAGPLKSHNAEILEAMILPIKLVYWFSCAGWLILCLLIAINSANCCLVNSIPCADKLCLIWLCRLTRPRYWCRSSSNPIATKTATLLPGVKLASLAALSATFIINNCCGIKLS